MKTGMLIADFAEKVKSDKAHARDFIADTRSMRLSENGRVLYVEDRPFSPTNILHRQVSERLQIPAKYYDRMKVDHPRLLAENVNYLFREVPERRMVRTLLPATHEVPNNQDMAMARAFLSSRYRRFDNWQVAEAVLPALADIDDMRIESSAITDRRLYIKAIFPKIQGEVQVGDVVQAGCVIRNSELGFGKATVELLLYRLECSNGMISPDYKAGRHHVGRELGGDDDGVVELLTDETLKADDHAFTLKLRDLVRAATNEATFNMQLTKLRETTKDVISQSPIDAVQVLASTCNLQECERDHVLNHLIAGGDLTRYGVINAVTRASQDVDDYERATELERLGGNLVNIPQTTWRTIADE
jgi:hypothetical protein